MDIVTIFVKVTETGQEQELNTRVNKARAIGEITAGLAKPLTQETEAVFLKGPCERLLLSCAEEQAMHAQRKSMRGKALWNFQATPF